MKLFPLILLAAMGSAHAQDRTNFNLNDGKVAFSVPAGWSAIMEKFDGNPNMAGMDGFFAARFRRKA